MERLNEHSPSGEKGAWVSITAYLFLSVLKLAIGLITNSKALVADGLNNTTDIIASLAILIGLKVSKKPPDENHRYGHSKAETISSMIAAFIMFTIGIEVLINTTESLLAHKTQAPNLTAAFVAIFGAIIMYFVYRYNQQLAKKLNSHALKAAAKDNLSDSLVSIGTAVGIFGSQFGMPWLDPLAALIVGTIICKTGFDIFKDASYMLSDGFDEQQLMIYKTAIEKVNGTEDVRDIKARVYGNEVYLDVVITVKPSLSVAESHEITEKIEMVMESRYNISYVHIHIEPAIKAQH